MISCINKTYKLITLWFLLWGSFLYAQSKVLYLERTLKVNPELTSANPALLQKLQDSILFNTKTYYKFAEGNFINYFEPNKSYTLGVETTSYNRINTKTVVYGLASYHFSKGKNTNGTTFLHPYRVPFNFIERDETTKGDKRIENYRLVGGLSYQFFPKIAFGIKADYQTISFSKLKDMRNINDILDFTLNTGISYTITPKNTIAISYNYNRYIENLRVNEYGNLEKDYYALVNSGAFMGLFQLYGSEGILYFGSTKKPWIDIVHQFGVTYNHLFSEKIKWFTELQYQKGKGLYGNDSEKYVVYMRHKKEGYTAQSKLIVKGNKINQVIGIKGVYTDIANNEQLFREVTTTAGNSITQYFGERETVNIQTTVAGINYSVLWGDTYFNAPWEVFADYTYNNIQRNATFFPFYRTQNIMWNAINLGIAKTLQHKNTNFLVKYKVGFIGGNGGYPVDGKLIQNISNVTPPDYLNNLLHKEREYLTGKRILTDITFRMSKNYSGNEVYAQLQTGYTNPFKTTYIQGDFFNFALSLGFTF